MLIPQVMSLSLSAFTSKGCLTTVRISCWTLLPPLFDTLGGCCLIYSTLASSTCFHSHTNVRQHTPAHCPHSIHHSHF